MAGIERGKEFVASIFVIPTVPLSQGAFEVLLSQLAQCLVVLISFRHHFLLDLVQAQSLPFGESQASSIPVHIE